MTSIAIIFAAASALPAAGAEPPVLGLTLIPPSPVSDAIEVEVRAAVRGPAAPAGAELSFYLDEESPGALLHRARPGAGPGAGSVSFRWPTAGRAGKHRIACVAEAGGRKLRAEEPIEVIAAGKRSLARLGGAWVDIYHHSEDEGRPFNAELAKMTAGDWRALVRAMHGVGQDILVITMMFQNYTHVGQHRIEEEGYRGKAYYPSKLFPGRMPIACPDPLDAILAEADDLDMHVLPGVGCYAFFDYTPGALRWCRSVAAELWEMYGRHRSFYGWYISAEIGGNLGTDDRRRQELVDFFREFRPFARSLAPDKPVMLATNCYSVDKANGYYEKLLPHLDIICPFAFHRMPAGDLTGEAAAALLQRLCDEAGCHLWMDLETFVFRNGVELHPRPIGGLASDLARFPNFEKILHYQFPGLMSGPDMPRKPGGEPSVKSYLDYRRFLEGGAGALLLRHAARGLPARLARPPDPRYPGGGEGGLTDGVQASEDYRDPAWQGYWGEDLEATIDLGRTVRIEEISSTYLQSVAGGIYLPAAVEYAVAPEGGEFAVAAVVTHDVPLRAEGPLIRAFPAKLAGVEARRARVRARSVRAIPAGHPAAGEKAWLFVDEVAVREATAPPR